MNAVLGEKNVISKVRGKWYEKNFGKTKISLIVSFHPAYLLRQPDQKKFSWADLKEIKNKIEQLKIGI